MMRLPAGLLLLCMAGPAWAEHKLAYDFRDARFDAERFHYVGPTPDKFLKPEAEGLRLRYTGADAPPTNTPSGVAWHVQVRGNFVATAQYEILECAPPSKGTFVAGAEIYALIDNPRHDAVMIARGVFPDGSTAINFKRLSTETQGKRTTKDFKRQATTAKSLRGRLRLARNGSIVTGSFAEGEDGPFTELQDCEVGTGDIRLVRFAGIAGGDRNVMLDMRILDFQLEGDELALGGRFLTPLPKTEVPRAEVPKPKVNAPRALSEDVPRSAPEPEPASKRNLLPMALVHCLLVIAVLVTVGILLLWRRRKTVMEDKTISARGKR